MKKVYGKAVKPYTPYIAPVGVEVGAGGRRTKYLALPRGTKAFSRRLAPRT